MTTRADLEAQLDRGPREVQRFLVYADFLLEQGAPQGELIRLQHALTPDSPQSAHVRELELRSELLPSLNAHGSQWHLGFPRALELSWVPDASVAELEETLRSPLCRFIESVTLTDYVNVPGIVEMLARLPHLREVGLRSNLEMHRPADALKLLAELGRLSNLRALALHVRIPSEQLNQLPRFPKLERLTLVGAHLDLSDAGMLRFARSRVPAQCVLELVQCGISFRVEERLRTVWPWVTEPLDVPGLVVIEPARHEGMWLLMAPSRRTIGALPTCDLYVDVPRTYAFVDRCIRQFHGPDLPLKEGGGIDLGNGVVVGFSENVEATRAYLTSLARTIDLTPPSESRPRGV